jgi:TolA-binding protein
MKNFDKIERYLKRKMTPEERSGFERELEEDQGLAREYKLHKEEHELLTFAVREQMREDIKAIGRERKSKPERAEQPAQGQEKQIYLNRKTILSVAATIAVLLVAYFLLVPRTGIGERIAMDSYNTHSPVFDNDSREVYDEKNPATKSAWQKNKKKLLSADEEEISAGIAFFNDQETATNEINYLLGIGHMNLRAFAQAEAYFKTFLDTEEKEKNYAGNDILFNAEYYYILSLMAQNKIEQAKLIYESLGDRHPYKKILAKDFRKLPRRMLSSMPFYRAS